MKTRKILFPFLLLLIITLTACANNNAQDNNADINMSSISTEEQSIDHG